MRGAWCWDVERRGRGTWCWEVEGRVRGAWWWEVEGPWLAPECLSEVSLHGEWKDKKHQLELKLLKATIIIISSALPTAELRPP